MKKFSIFTIAMLASSLSFTTAASLDPEKAISINEWRNAPTAEKEQVCHHWLTLTQKQASQLIPNSYTSPLGKKEITDCVKLLDSGADELSTTPMKPEEMPSMQDTYSYIYSRIADFSRP